jgi:hypothetical protein
MRIRGSSVNSISPRRSLARTSRLRCRGFLGRSEGRRHAALRSTEPTCAGHGRDGGRYASHIRAAMGKIG